MRAVLWKDPFKELQVAVIARVEGRVPLGKLQEANHFLWGVDISQRVVRVHQYKPSDDKTLQ